jgi:histone deacetylase 1/2
MALEYDALLRNHTWRLVDPPPGAHVISGKWVFKHKLNPNGTLERYKARWVVRGFTQRAGVDFDETFSPVVKPATIRTVLTIAASRRWTTKQLDVSNAFLHGHLKEHVFCQQPTGFVDAERPNAVCLLDKSLYGLRQAPRAWFTRFANFAVKLGFHATRSDSSLFVLRHGDDIAYLLLYVDDIVLTGSSPALLQHVVDHLRAEFAVKDMGELRFFLGIDVKRTSTGFYLSQEQYAEDILQRAGMSSCKPVSTPVDSRGKLPAAGAAIDDVSSYRRLAGALMYLTITRPDLASAVQQACLHMHDPRAPHMTMLKRILRYVRGTSSHGLHLHASPTLDITVYSDADWAGCPDTRRSTSGFCVFLGESLVSWSSKRQPTVSRSSAEAEYRAVANVAAECIWLRQLLGELHCHIDKATVVYCDNVSAVYMSSNPVHHKQTKHIELDIHFVRERVQLGDLRVLHVPTGEQFADVMTKGLPTSTFEAFRSSLCVAPHQRQTAGGDKSIYLCTLYTACNFLRGSPRSHVHARSVRSVD